MHQLLIVLVMLLALEEKASAQHKIGSRPQAAASPRFYGWGYGYGYRPYSGPVYSSYGWPYGYAYGYGGYQGYGWYGFYGYGSYPGPVHQWNMPYTPWYPAYMPDTPDWNSIPGWYVDPHDLYVQHYWATWAGQYEVRMAERLRRYEEELEQLETRLYLEAYLLEQMQYFPYHSVPEKP